MKKPVICLIGPTASGKTDLACALYDTLPVDIISIDSAQIYQGLDIGSAKPDRAFLERYPHHLIDILPPEARYSAGECQRDVTRLINTIHARNRIPLLAGGTMLYYNALFAGLADLPAADPALRAELETRWQHEGPAVLHAELAALDPESAARIHTNDPQRLLRAHELLRLTGKTPSQLYAAQSQHAPPWHTLTLALLPERTLLHQRIAQRFHTMMQQGFLDEVRTLRARPQLTAAHPSMRSVGYRQLWQHLDGATTLDEAIELGIIATRQLAKRQITWMRNRLGRTLNPHFIDPLAPDAERTALSLVRAHLPH
ncbi:MAG: tRNA (adenosine(37)-N6)-dimethylallyltransferase MiaA [Cardiobacteriaceae bacterium]|nr:tRNA (adenosine(37)-N6)-dimethylallyltransferase MiaA [Cardiobacteriaceae bacterium]